MVFRDLPPEIQSLISRFCSPSDLATLSRVHTSGRDIAECALYSRIQYRARPSDLIIPSRDAKNDESSQALKEGRSLLHTLINNSRKALMVKMFDVELDNERHAYRKATQFVLVKLAEVLVKMPNLVDLRILHGPMEDLDKGIESISEVMRGNHFKLHTLYLEYNYKLERIVADQPHLRVLGIHTDTRVAKIKQLHQSLSHCRTMPTVFALTDVYVGPTITMFPAFQHPGGALQACRDVASSLSNWSHVFRGKDKYHLSVSLLGTLEEDISSLSELVEAMATCLQDYCPRADTYFSVIIHEKSIQKPWRFPEFIKALALFEVATSLNVVYPELDYEKWFQMATDLEFCMVNKNLGCTWPSLQEIIFICTEMSDLLLMRRRSNWKILQCTSGDEDFDFSGSDDE